MRDERVRCETHSVDPDPIFPRMVLWSMPLHPDRPSKAEPELVRPLGMRVGVYAVVGVGVKEDLGVILIRFVQREVVRHAAVRACAELMSMDMKEQEQMRERGRDVRDDELLPQLL